jgi:FkbM family methyltransferase
MVGGIDRINAESPESNANSLLRSLSFEAKPHLSRGGLAGVEGMAAPSRKSGEEWGIRVVPAEAGAVRTVTIPELIRMSGQDRVSLLKVDIEGAETELFQSCQGWLPQVDNIVVELHGANAEKIFHSAIAGSGFVVSQCDELTVCLQPPPPQSP